MDSITLQVVFEGHSVNPGRIDAEAFASALTGYAMLFKRANTLLNGDECNTEVLVESEFERGSFVAYLSFQALAGNIITAHQFLDASGLAKVLGYLWESKSTVFDLLKMLRGHNPERVIQQGDNSQVIYGGVTNTFNNCVVQVYNDPDAKKALSDLTSSLQIAGIDRVSIGPREGEKFALQKSDEITVDLGANEEEPSEDIDAGEREALLTIGKVVFDEKKNWTFFERGSTVLAPILDSDFWSRVHARTLLFGEGDQMKVKLKWRLEFKKGKVHQHNSILKVLELKSRAHQLSLQPEN